MLSSGRRVPYCVLCSFSNGPSFGNLPARRSTAGAGLGTFPHSLDMFVLSALCSTGFTDVGADTAQLMRKPRISREQSNANATYWRALMTEADRLRHR